MQRSDVITLLLRSAASAQPAHMIRYPYAAGSYRNNRITADTAYYTQTPRSDFTPDVHHKTYLPYIRGHAFSDDNSTAMRAVDLAEIARRFGFKLRWRKDPYNGMWDARSRTMWLHPASSTNTVLHEVGHSPMGPLSTVEHERGETVAMVPETISIGLAGAMAPKYLPYKQMLQYGPRLTGDLQHDAVETHRWASDALNKKTELGKMLVQWINNSKPLYPAGAMARDAEKAGFVLRGGYDHVYGTRPSDKRQQFLEETKQRKVLQQQAATLRGPGFAKRVTDWFMKRRGVDVSTLAEPVFKLNRDTEYGPALPISEKRSP